MFDKYKKTKESLIKNENEGFSLLEIVVSVGILLVLTVGGLLAYNGITSNARQAATNNTTSELHTYMMNHYVNESDISAEDALTQWVKSSDKFSKGQVHSLDPENNSTYLVADSLTNPTYRIVLYTGDEERIIDDRTIKINGAYVEIWDGYGHPLISNGEISNNTYIAERG